MVEPEQPEGGSLERFVIGSFCFAAVIFTFAFLIGTPVAKTVFICISEAATQLLFAVFLNHGNLWTKIFLFRFPWGGIEIMYSRQHCRQKQAAENIAFHNYSFKDGSVYFTSSACSYIYSMNS